jgi:hypothetical protein
VGIVGPRGKVRGGGLAKSQPPFDGQRYTTQHIQTHQHREPRKWHHNPAAATKMPPGRKQPAEGNTLSHVNNNPQYNMQRDWCDVGSAVGHGAGGRGQRAKHHLISSSTYHITVRQVVPQPHSYNKDYPRAQTAC